MYNEVWWAVYLFVLKIEFVIMILKFISSLFSKNRVKITVNAVFLLFFDLCWLLVFNISDCDRFKFVSILDIIFIMFISLLGDINKTFKPDKTFDNKYGIADNETITKNTEVIKENLPHSPIGKTIKTKNIKSIPSDNIISME